MKKTNKVISLVLALVMALSILVVIPTASATSTVRINEVNANVGYSIVYNIYLQTDEKANTMEGRLNYDNTVLDLTSLSFDTANSFCLLSTSVLPYFVTPLFSMFSHFAIAH